MEGCYIISNIRFGMTRSGKREFYFFFRLRFDCKGIVTSHTAFVYEDVCREKMWDLNAEDAWPFHFSRLGRFWEGDTEIDIAALDAENKNLILGECKYWQTPVGANVLRELEQKVSAVSWEKGRRQVWYVLFSTGGFTEELHALAEARGDVLLVDDGE